jgi:glutathione S-transferase
VDRAARLTYLDGAEEDPMKLYYVPQTRAVRVRWMLEELEVPYELVRVDVAKREQKSPAYLEVHPLGHVPALVDGDLTLFESAAICTWLADRYPDKRLAPEPGTPERGLYYQWLFYAATELEPPLQTLSQHTRRLPEERRIPAVIEPARALFAAAADGLARGLGEREFLVGERFTTADLIVASLLFWARGFGLTDPPPSLTAYAQRLLARPAAQRARAD